MFYKKTPKQTEGQESFFRNLGVLFYMFSLRLFLGKLAGKSALRARVLSNNTAQSQKSQCVGNNHQVVKEVRKLPNQIVGEKRTEEDKANGHNRVNDGGNLAVLEEILHI